MEVRTISKRLETVASFVPKGARLLDVGSDHAYLPIYLKQIQQIDVAIAGEVVEGPYQSALKNVAEHGLEDSIQVRLANGLAAVQLEDKMDTITIAGMGGRLIADILAADLEKVATVSRLVLQPNNREDELRAWLQAHQFSIVAETILEEAGKIYEILVVQHGQMTLTDQELRFGPFLLQEKSSVFEQKWQREKEKLVYALSRIPEKNEADRESLSRKIQAIEEVLR